MKQFALFLCLLTAITSHGQTFRPNINKDSLFKASIAWMNLEKKEEYEKMYAESDEKNKGFIVFMLSMPSSSKKEMIRNIDTNYNRITALKDAYLRIVPPGYVVRIEYTAPSKVIISEESFDLRISKKVEEGTTTDQAWHLGINSDTLHRMLTKLHWTLQTLNSIKQWLSDAHCIGIENGKTPVIEFARSGFGLFSIKLFDHDLEAAEIAKYNDGCQYLFYRNNIVLEYVGGAVGPQCFSSIDPDR